MFPAVGVVKSTADVVMLKLHLFDLLWICCTLNLHRFHNKSNQWSLTITGHMMRLRPLELEHFKFVINYTIFNKNATL